MQKCAAGASFCRVKAYSTATFTATFIFRFQKCLIFRHETSFASNLHPEGRRFEPVIAHYKALCSKQLRKANFLSLLPKNHGATLGSTETDCRLQAAGALSLRKCAQGCR